MRSSKWQVAAACSLAVGAVCLLHLQAEARLGVPRRAVLGGVAAHGAANHSQPGYLGIAFHDVSEAEVASLKLKDAHGASIVRVDHDGPAGKAGLRERDVVLSLNGAAVDGEEALRRMLRDLSPGRTVTLNICRDGSERTVTAVLAVKVDVEKQAWEQHWVVPEPAADDASSAPPPPVSRTAPSHSFLGSHLSLLMPAYTGVVVDPLGSQLAEFFGIREGKGMLVHEVEPNSPAATAGLRAGDVVTRVNGSAVATEKDWSRALHDSKGHPVSLTVVRERREQILTMIPESKHRSAVDLPPGTAAGSRAKDGALL